ncbi:hypothetical protein RB195_024541 [Necator americanus]|uniref:Uncharacterized protein n=1 Tax=Necator americanus TaxID=51031 RepID=A0ABR1ENR2_NECAM
MRHRPVISIENYTIYCGDADENKAGGCAIAVRNDRKNLVEEFGSTSSRRAFLRLRDRRAPNRTSDNGDHLVDLCEQTVSSSLARVRGIIDAITSPGRVNPYNACRAVQVEDEDS